MRCHLKRIEYIIGLENEHSLEIKLELHFPLHRRHQFLQFGVLFVDYLIRAGLDLNRQGSTVFFWRMKKS